MSRTVIKSPIADAVTRGYRGLDLRDISAQAEAILAAARLEARRLLDEARAEAEALKENAHREGHAAGLTQGRTQGHEAALSETRDRLKSEASVLLAALDTLVREFDSRRETLYTQARRDLVVLAVAIAQRVAARLTAIEGVAPEMAAQACAEALSLVGEATQVLVRVHPADAEAITELTAELAETLHACRHVRLVEDEAVGRGGVIVETQDSRIDATLSQRLDRIADELATGWRQRLDDLSVTS